MSKVLTRLGLVAWLAFMAGCSGTAPASVAPEGDLDTIPGTDISLGALLQKPRPELAHLADDLTNKIQVQLRAIREGRVQAQFLPDLPLPVAVPVWREAKYHADTGISLPPYLAPGQKDPELALHLARYGDAEAARKLADDKDQATLKQIESLAYSRNYPAEWTRVVGLMFHDAQVRLACGYEEAARELVGMHRQLQKLLDPSSQKGPLGDALLASGREAVRRAAIAFRTEKKDKQAAEAEAVLASWSEPGDIISQKPGWPRAEFDRTFPTTPGARAVPATATLRAMDLLALPFPDESADGVIAFLNDADQIVSLLLTYKPGIGKYFPEPAALAHLMEERGVTGKQGQQQPGMKSQSYRAGDWLCETVVVPRGVTQGAFAYFSSPAASPPPTNIRRDFGAFHFDRSFEQNRVRLAPEQRGERLVVRNQKPLDLLRNPLPTMKPTVATLYRDQSKDLASKLHVQFAKEANGAVSLHETVAPLWATLGPAQFVGQADDNGGHMALIWQDDNTQVILHLPFEQIQAVKFEATDRQSDAQLSKRLEQVADLDRKERKSRLETGKPLRRISRTLELFELGMKRADVMHVLPSGRSAQRLEIPGGLSVVFPGEPQGTERHVMRQAFLRFDALDQLIEIQVRYVDGPANGASHWSTDLLKALVKSYGAYQEKRSPWASLWPDLPAQKPAPACVRWQDDVSALTYERDGGGVELTLVNCPLEHENGTPMPPLEYLPRGVERCLLGSTRQEFFQQWNITQPTYTEDRALILRPDPSTSYDALLVWFQDDKAVRIIARHVQPTGKTVSPAQWAQAVREVWGRGLKWMGWPRRQDTIGKDTVQGLGWHDDVTRLRVFWQEDESGHGRLYSEWKSLPRR